MEQFEDLMKQVALRQGTYLSFWPA
jgi:hypothetical protein